MLVFCLLFGFAVQAQCVCNWFGTAPFCNGQCPVGEQMMYRSHNGQHDHNDQVLLTEKEFGKGCWIGYKAYCCKEQELVGENLLNPVVPAPSRSNSHPLTDGQLACLRQCGILLPHTPQSLQSQLDIYHYAPEKAFPWSAKIMIRLPRYCTARKTANLCTGFIVHEKYVLTSAHCFYYPHSECELEHQSRESPKLYLRANSAWAIIQTGLSEELTRKAKQVHILKDYMRNTPQFQENDVAIVELEKPLTFTQTIRPICLPTSYTPLTGTMAFGSGYVEMKNGKMTETLQELMLPLTSDADCSRIFEKLNTTTNGCAGNATRNIEQVDSESCPAVPINGKWFQVGVFSRVIEYSNGTQGPDLYSKVSSACSFISNVTNNEVYCVDPESASNNDNGCVNTLMELVQRRVVIAQTAKEDKINNDENKQEYVNKVELEPDWENAVFVKENEPLLLPDPIF